MRLESTFFFHKQFSVVRPHISIHKVATAATVKIRDSLINDVCLNKVQRPSSSEEMSSESQIEMMQVEAAQLAIKATNVADDGSSGTVFSGWV